MHTPSPLLPPPINIFASTFVTFSSIARELDRCSFGHVTFTFRIPVSHSSSCEYSLPCFGATACRVLRTFLTHALPRSMPSDADKGGGKRWERVRRHHRAGGPLLGPPPRVSVNLVPLLWTPAFDTIRPGGPTKTSADVSVSRLAGFSLIT